jgi:hypothetical protein
VYCYVITSALPSRNFYSPVPNISRNSVVSIHRQFSPHQPLLMELENGQDSCAGEKASNAKPNA